MSRRLFAVPVMALMLLLAACGTQTPSASPIPTPVPELSDPQEILEKSTVALLENDSFSMNGSLKIDIKEIGSEENQSIAMLALMGLTSLEMEAQVDLTRPAFSADISTSADEPLEIFNFIMVEGDTYMRSPLLGMLGMGGSGDKWQKDSDESFDSASWSTDLAEAREQLAQEMDKAFAEEDQMGLSKGADEPCLNDPAQQCYVIEGEATPEQLEELGSETEELGSETEEENPLGGDVATPEVDDVSIKIVVNKDTLQLEQMSVLAGSEEFDMIFELNFSGFGEPVTITEPDAADVTEAAEEESLNGEDISSPSPYTP